MPQAAAGKNLHVNQLNLSQGGTIVMVVDHVHWGAPTKGSSGLIDTQGTTKITKKQSR